MSELIQSYPTLKDYYTALKQAEMNASPSEIHGILCGLICAGHDLQDGFSLDNILLHLGRYACHKITLLRLYSDISLQLIKATDHFDLLLPSEKTRLSVQANALNIWCKGFISGLSIYLDLPLFLEGQSERAFKSLSIISKIAQLKAEQLDIDDLEEQEAFEEVKAFVMNAVPFIYQAFSVSHMKQIDRTALS
jgi:uncharacterized protein